MPRTRQVTVNGIRWELDLREVIDASLYFSGTFEPAAERTIDSILRPGMIVIDVGANIGYHALRMARCVGPGGRVVAVEPCHRAFARLMRNIELNAFANVHPVRVALGEADEDGVKRLVQSSYPLDGSPGATSEVIDVRRLDSLVHHLQLPRIDFIKMDVDGYEARVLSGGLDSLERFRPAVFFELTPGAVERLGDPADWVLEVFLGRGYRMADETGRPLEDVHAYVRERHATGFNLLAVPQVDG